MGTQVMPQVLHRVQFRRVGQQPDQAHVLRHHESTAHVVPRVVPQEHPVHTGGQLAGVLLQEQIDHCRVQFRHDQPHRRTAGGAHRREHVQRLSTVLPHPAGPRAAACPDPGEGSLLAKPGLVLVPDLDVLVGVLCRDRRDVLDDDLLEELLGLGVRLGMLWPRHQVAVAEPVEQPVNPAEAVAGTELLLQEPADVAAAPLPGLVLGARRGVDVLQEGALQVMGQSRSAAGVGAVRQRVQTARVVGGHPRLDGAAAEAQGAGDLACGIALLGQDDGLHPGPGACRAKLPGRLLKAVQRVVVLDAHEWMSLPIRVRKPSPGTTKQRMAGCAEFSSVPYKPRSRRPNCSKAGGPLRLSLSAARPPHSQCMPLALA